VTDPADGEKFNLGINFPDNPVAAVCDRRVGTALIELRYSKARSTLVRSILCSAAGTDRRYS